MNDTTATCALQESGRSQRIESDGFRSGGEGEYRGDGNCGDNRVNGSGAGDSEEWDPGPGEPWGGLDGLGWAL